MAKSQVKSDKEKFEAYLSKITNGRPDLALKQAMEFSSKHKRK